MKNQLSKTQILLVVIFSATVLAGALYAFFFYVVERKVASAREIFGRVEELENEQNKHSRLSSFLRTYAPDIEIVEGRFIKESDIALFAKQLEDIGAQAGVVFALESLEPSTGQKKEPVLNVRIKATADFAKVLYFAELVESFPTTLLELSTMRLVRTSEMAGMKTAAVTAESDKMPGKTALPQWELSVSATVLNFVKE